MYYSAHNRVKKTKHGKFYFAEKKNIVFFKSGL